MKSILLVGGGGHCRSCIDVIEASEHYEVAGIVERNGVDYFTLLGYPLLGNDSDLLFLLKKYPSALVTVGQIKSSDARQKLYAVLKKLGAELPTIVSPHAYVSSRSLVGPGTIVMHGAIINISASIGENCIINTQALIEHDVQIGSHCHVSTGAKLNGGVKIDAGSFIGSGAVIREGITIGAGCIIGAGSFVYKDLEPGTTFRGHK